MVRSEEESEVDVTIDVDTDIFDRQAHELLTPPFACLKVLHGCNVDVGRNGANCQAAVLFRVLIYLEAAALGRPKPVFAAHLTQALLAAAVALGLRSLEVTHQCTSTFTR